MTIEAFSCGIPVIASRLGAMAELVDDGKTGLLSEPGNSNELAECAKRLWNTPWKQLEWAKMHV